MAETNADSESDRKGGLTIRELSPELLADFLSFFDHDAFADNPDWSGCYCMYYYLTGTDEGWFRRSASENREGISDLIRKGKAHGLLAYMNGKPVGWCHAAPRATIPRLDDYEQLKVEDPERVGSIVCFVVAKPYRRRGIARHLLNSACEVFIRRGLAFAEAYPLKRGETDADNFPGHLKMYLDAGFSVFRELEKYYIVRKAL